MVLTLALLLPTAAGAIDLTRDHLQRGAAVIRTMGYPLLGNAACTSPFVSNREACSRLEALRRAIDDAGEAQPAFEPHPTQDQGSHDRSLARLCRQAAAVDGTPDARRKAFQRAYTTLLNGHYIGVWEPHVWIV